MPLWDLDRVRALFPSLREDMAFLDNAGMSQIPGRVIDALQAGYRTQNVQLGGFYDASEAAVEAMARGRQAAARMLGLNGSADDARVLMGASMTQLAMNMSQSLAPSLEPGDEIIVTVADHEANIGPWLRLADRGATIRWWQPRPDSWLLEPDDIEPLLSPKTKLVALTHASNIVGVAHDVETIAARIRSATHALVMVDGVAYAPHRFAQPMRWGADLYAVSWYKIFGPHLSSMVVSARAQQRLSSINHYFKASDPVERLEVPGPSYAAMKSLPAILEHLESLAESDREGDALAAGYQAIEHVENKLTQQLLGGLTSIPGVRVFGSTESAQHLPLVSFLKDGESAESLARRCVAAGAGVRHGHSYAKRLTDAMGLDDHGVVRASLAHYNSAAEIDRLLNAVEGSRRS